MVQSDGPLRYATVRYGTDDRWAIINEWGGTMLIPASTSDFSIKLASTTKDNRRIRIFG